MDVDRECRAVRTVQVLQGQRTKIVKQKKEDKPNSRKPLQVSPQPQLQYCIAIVPLRTSALATYHKPILPHRII